MVRYTLLSRAQKVIMVLNQGPLTSTLYNAIIILRLMDVIAAEENVFTFLFRFGGGKMRKPSILLCFLEVLRTVCKSNDKSSSRVIQYAK